MPRSERKELSFQTGEISPRYYGRSDTEVYDKGLAIAENVIIDKRGGAFKRHGLIHIGQLDGNNARVFTIQVSRVEFYTVVIYYDIVLDKGRLTIIAPGASFIGNNLLLNGNFNDSGDNWTVTVAPVTSQVQFSPGEARLLPETDDLQIVTEPDFANDGISWISRISHVQSTVTFIDGICTLTPRQVALSFAGIAQQITSGAAGEEHTMTLTGNFGANLLDVKIGTVEGDGTYFDQAIGAQDGEVSFTFTPAASPFFITLDCIFPETFIQLDRVEIDEPVTKFAAISQQATVVAAETDTHIVVVGQSTNSRITVQVGTTDGATDLAEYTTTALESSVGFVPNNPTYWVRVLADGDFEADAPITFVGTAAEVVAGGIGLDMDAPWTEAQLDEIHYIQSPEGETMYFTHPQVTPQQLVYSFINDTFVPLTDVPFINPPAAWSGTNQPATGAHFEGRLWFGGAPFTGRQTVWASVSGSPIDFTKEAGVASGSLEFVLQEFGRIEWMLGTKTMLIGAENGEHIISSEGPVITDTDFKIDQQSSFGSNNMQGVQVGEKVFYATPDGRQLRAMAYEWQEDNWLSQDLSYISEHITAGIIKHRCWAQHPESLFLIALEDGTMTNMTYDRTAQTIAWSHITVPGYFVFDLETARRNGRNEVILVGQRTTGKIDLDATADDLEYLDSYASNFYPSGGNVVDGLDHLEGESVRPLVDGAVEPNKTVVGGQITTDRSGNQLHAGMDYEALIKTLPPDVPQGQIRSWKKRWNKVWAYMLGSNAPIVNGTRPPDRFPQTPMDTPEPARTGHFKTVNLHWDDDGQITISQDLPVPMNVLAIYGEMGQETVD